MIELAYGRVSDSRGDSCVVAVDSATSTLTVEGKFLKWLVFDEPSHSRLPHYLECSFGSEHTQERRWMGVFGFV